MSLSLTITLNDPAPGTGPFDIYSVDGLGNVTGPIASGIPRETMMSGYTIYGVPSNAVNLLVESNNAFCQTSIEIIIPTTTTTTTTSTTTTTTSTTTTTTTTTTCAPQSFTMQATGVTTVTFTEFSSTNSVKIIWETGVEEMWDPGDPDPTHTYDSYYTGDIVIQSCDLSSIEVLNFRNTNSPSPVLPSNGLLTILDTELTKLTGLITCDIYAPRVRFEKNGGVTTSTSLLPSGLTTFKSSNNDMDGDVADLPTGLTIFMVEGTNTISGVVADIPSNMVTFSVLGSNTIDGLIGDMPLSIVTFIVYGVNTIHGKLSDMPGDPATPTQSNTNPNLLEFNVLGNNYIYGDLSDINWRKVTLFNLGGVKNQPTPETTSFLSGDLDTLPVISVMDGGDGVHKFRTDMRVLGHSYGYSTITGDVNNFPDVFVFYSLNIGGENNGATNTSYAGNPGLGYPAYPAGGWGNTLSGNIGDVPHTGMITLNIAGRNTITGNISTFLPAPRCDFFQILGSNTISGDLTDLPPLVRTVNIQGANNVNTYSASRTWAGGATPPFSGTPYSMCKFILKSSVSGNKLNNQTQIDNLVTDLNANNLWRNYGTIGAEVIIRSAFSPSGAAIAELAALDTKTTPPVLSGGLGATVIS